MGRWFGVVIAAVGLLAAPGCDVPDAEDEVGFRECSERQWERVLALSAIEEPVACETNDAEYRGDDALFVRVEHSRQCEMVCNAHGCQDDAVCPSQIAMLADDGVSMKLMTNVTRITHAGLMGRLLSDELGFDPFDVMGIDLRNEATLSIVVVEDDLCLEVDPPAPLIGSYTDCGRSMPEFSLGFSPFILSFEDALEAAQPLVAPGGQWDRSNVALAFDEEDPAQSRWTFLVDGESTEVDMQGNVFRHR